MLGLLEQFNKISIYAHEVFTDILATTTDTAQRIQRTKQRVKSLHERVPEVEKMLVGYAPNSFYDHPFIGKEYQRNDDLHGLLFSREDALPCINRRRNDAFTAFPSEIPQMDPLSDTGACIKNFTDADFFINEWLENEKRKREEERERRRQMKAERKKVRVKRKQHKTIQKLQRKRYDHQGKEIFDVDEPTEVKVTEYELIDDSKRDFNALLNKKQRDKPKTPQLDVSSVTKPPVSIALDNLDAEETTATTTAMKVMTKPSHRSQVSYAVPENVAVSKSKHVAMHSRPPPNPLQMGLELETPTSEEKQMELSIPSSLKERTTKRLSAIASAIPLDDISFDIDENTRSPDMIYAQAYQKRDLEKEELKLDLAAA
eukprot:CAMPEP_0202732638 /NCGR_PEP_ID=MMETSP1385-20130828/187763_1 /ASSEMBLY_ACC=CAM_ASM_000861 /TAXON_ID=933848 /ORGANISM="Elphidium margaritaceum" /LENGTH=372 /DNA_ID=CAMNT_0049398961 /DNA_START=36 /DNA_END=1150 /DNA_ORIENTATION=-